jgi:hypothetical protein
MDNIAMGVKENAREGVYWIHLAQDRHAAMRRAPVNMEMNHRKPWNALA